MQPHLQGLLRTRAPQLQPHLQGLLRTRARCRVSRASTLPPRPQACSATTRGGSRGVGLLHSAWATLGEAARQCSTRRAEPPSSVAAGGAMPAQQLRAGTGWGRPAHQEAGWVVSGAETRCLFRAQRRGAAKIELVMGGRGCGSGGDQQTTGLELCTGLNGHVSLSAAAKALVNELPTSALDGQVTDDRFQLRIIMWQTSCKQCLWTGWL